MQFRTLALLMALAAAQPAHAADSAASPPAGPIPIDAFVHRDQYSMPLLSPDGKYLAITVRMKRGQREVPTICVLALPKLNMLAAVQLPVFQIPAGYLWVSNTRLAVAKGEEVGVREAPQLTGEVLAMDFDGGKQEYLYGMDGFKFSRQSDRYGDDYGYGEIAGAPKPLNGHLLLNSHLWRVDRSQLYDINTSTAIRKLVAEIPVRYMRFILQRDGTPRFAYGTDEQNEPLLYQRDIASGNWSVLPADKGGDIYPFAFSPDGREFAATQNVHGGPDILVRQNSASGARTVLMSHPAGNINDYLFGANHGLPLAATTQVGMPQWTYFAPQHADAQLHKQLSAQFPGNVVDFINFTSDGQLLLFSVRSDRDPGSYYLFDRRSGKADFLLAAMEAIEPEQMAERRPISFKARDGLELHGYITLPPATAGTPPGHKPPLVLMPHGGPFGPFDTWYFDTDAQFLASRGYAVLQVNYRGSGGRGRSFREAGYRKWGTAIQDDLADGVRWVQAQGLSDPGRSCVYGVSFGGYSALMLAARESALFRCAIGYAGVYDLRRFKDEPMQNVRKERDWLSKRVGDDAQELAHQSPAVLAGSITMPVLLIHGGKDKIAPKEHAFQMRDALTAAGRPPQWLYVDYEGHGFYDTENAADVYRTLEAFLAKHLK
jgi:dipeptidyl aminopeptidase/acylaminoacyl peptidase